MNYRIAENYCFTHRTFVNGVQQDKKFRASARVRVKFRNFLKLAEFVNPATWEKSHKSKRRCSSETYLLALSFSRNFWLKLVELISNGLAEVMFVLVQSTHVLFQVSSDYNAGSAVLNETGFV